MKLWHDNERCPPDESWTWVRTNAQAIAYLRAHEVAEISLDHDLGVDPRDPDLDFVAGRSEHDGSGLDLVEAMCAEALVPPRVTIHSWNADGAEKMAARLHYSGYDCMIRPYEEPPAVW